MRLLGVGVIGIGVAVLAAGFVPALQNGLREYLFVGAGTFALGVGAWLWQEGGRASHAK